MKNLIGAISLAIIFSFLVGINSDSIAKSNDTRVKSTDDKPVIGLNMAVRGKNPTVCKISTHYINAVLESGGIPILIPPMEEKNLSQLFEKLDGVLLVGGRDYPPAIYGKKDHKAIVEMHPKRTSLDSSMAKLTLAHEKMPFLGICAGAQILNIQSGGTLVRDIPTRFKTSKYRHAHVKGWQTGSNTHPVKLNKNTKISKIYKRTKLAVPSSHHQAVDKIGEGLVVTGYAPDGVKESYETKDKDRFIVGVQWHPEMDLKNNHKLFDEFIKQCVIYKSSKQKASNLANAESSN